MRKLKRGERRDAEDPEDDPRAPMRRLIEDNANGNDEGYHDEEEEEPVNNRALEAPSGGNEGPRVVPSPLTEHSNEWRNEGEQSRA